MRFINRFLSMAGAASAALIANSAAAQTYTTYTDRASFLAALSNPTVQTFNSVTTDVTIANNGSYTIGDLTISRTGSASSNAFIDASPFGGVNVNGTTDFRTLAAAGSTNTFSFANSQRAFGADFAGLNDGQQRTTFQVNGSTLTPPVIPSGSGTSFFGFIGSSDFSSVSLVSSVNDGYAADNVTYAGVAAAPEPGTWVLMIVGFGFVGGTLRRSRRQQNARLAPLAA